MDLTLQGWRLNAARILDRLIDVIRNNNGKMVRDFSCVSDSEPIEVKDQNTADSVYHLRALNSVRFVIDTMACLVRLDSNPIYNPVYSKEYIDTDGTVSAHQSMQSIPWCWFKNENPYHHLSEEDVNRSAEALFAWLKNADVTTRFPTRDRTAFCEV